MIVNIAPAITSMMCANMVVQNTQRIERNKREEEKKKRVQPTFETTFNKEKRDK